MALPVGTDHAIVTRLESQLAASGVAHPRDVAIERLQHFGILDARGALTPYGLERDRMTAAERAIDREARRSGRDAGDYGYDPSTNRATLRQRRRR